LARHFLKPEFDPSWRMVSEYAIGRWGWVMQLAFFSLTIATLSGRQYGAPERTALAEFSHREPPEFRRMD
jgi:hypothetical protein